MKQLIKIKKNENGVQAVSAKEMYLSIGLNPTHWKRWAKRNIEENIYAMEGKDWGGFATMANGNETKDYVLTLDFAKKLCMKANTQQGEDLRNYFLECERKAQAKEEAKKIATPKAIPMQSENTPVTVKAYAFMSKVNLGIGELSALGKRATTLCRERGIFIEKQTDPRHGYEIGFYPVEILRQVFTEYLPQRLA